MEDKSLKSYYENCKCLNSWQLAPTSLSADKSFGTILANISLKPTEFALAMLVSHRDASSVREPIK